MKALLVLIFVPCLSSVAGWLWPKASKCYGKYGCFDKKPPFDRLWEELPQSPDKIGTQFHLFTRTSSYSQELDDSDVKKLLASRFDGNKKTVIIVHGFRESGSVPWVNKMRQALLKKEDVNVIVMDWKGVLNELLYNRAVGDTRLVGAQIAELIKFLIRHSHNSASMYHVIGFSLGAHVAGYAGRRLRLGGKTLGRISGLDPAGPMFTREPTDVRLDPSDADFVDVVHTDSNLFGLSDVSGHIDFYPNGGADQGCRKLEHGLIKFTDCDHKMAPDYYIESISGNCPQIAYPCSSADAFDRGECVKCNDKLKCTTFGYNSVKSKGKLSGKFFLYLKVDKPHCGIPPGSRHL